MTPIARARESLLKIWPDGANCNHVHAREVFKALDEAEKSDLRTQLNTLDPMHPNPSCWWDGDDRVAAIFHRDRPGDEVLRLVGESSRIDHLARMLADIQDPQPLPPPPVCASEGKP